MVTIQFGRGRKKAECERKKTKKRRKLLSSEKTRVRVQVGPEADVRRPGAPDEDGSGAVPHQKRSKTEILEGPDRRKFWSWVNFWF